MVNKAIQIILALLIFILLIAGYFTISKMQDICEEEKEKIKRNCSADLFEEKYKQIMKGIDYEKVNIIEHNDSIEFSF